MQMAHAVRSRPWSNRTGYRIARLPASHAGAAQQQQQQQQPQVDLEAVRSSLMAPGRSPAIGAMRERRGRDGVGGVC